MIRKLRLKFVMTALISVLAVLLVLVGGINVINYGRVLREADELLHILSDNGGMFPDRMIPGSGDFVPAAPPDMGFNNRIGSPEIVFETRFFSVKYDSEGNVLHVDTDRVSAVSEDTALEYASSVLGKNKTSGFVGDYRYLVSDPFGTGKQVVFCDRGASLSNFRSFRNISLIGSVLSLIIIGIIIYLISGRAVRPVAEAHEKQKRFVSDAGHEIKTPLAIIKADADVLSMDCGEDNEWIADILKQTDRLTCLTNDLITLSKMEEGRDTLVKEETDVSKLAEDAADSFKALAISGNKEFSSDIVPGVLINCDKKSVYELMNILLENAVKYCPEGRNISFKLSSEGKKALISVTNDLEKSMDKEVLERLFDRFYRADSSRNSETGGFGIGLSVARAIAEAHNGHIFASSEGMSVTFTAVL